MSKYFGSHQSSYAILDRMKGGLKTQGFTIVETLIVLAVTGGLFVVIAASLSGRQAKTQFQQSIQEVRSQIEQVINDVSVGYYPNSANFQCSASGLGPSITAGSTAQGQNTGCIFLGKAIQFQINGTDPEQYRVYPIAGLQRDSTGAEVTTYAAAKPKVIAPSTSNPSVPNGSSSQKLNYGLTTASLKYGSGAGTNVGAIAFVSSLASYSSGSLVSGSQQINVIPITGSVLNSSATAGAEVINSSLATSPVNPAGIKLCFANAQLGQSGLITIGGSGRQLDLSLVIKGNTTCS